MSLLGETVYTKTPFAGADSSECASMHRPIYSLLSSTNIQEAQVDDGLSVTQPLSTQLKPVFAAEAAAVMPLADVSLLVAAVASEICGHELEENDDFASHHFDSLAAVELASSISKTLAITVSSKPHFCLCITHCQTLVEATEQCVKNQSKLAGCAYD